MLSDLDLWRAAQIMVKGYGDGAAIEAAMRADEFLDQGSLDGERLGQFAILSFPGPVHRTPARCPQR